jgi:hypothetical protein
MRSVVGRVEWVAMTSALASIAEDLCQAVDGVDWDAQRVQSLDEALAVIAARVARARVEDADGVAHAAISGGALVEWGAGPRPLAESLLAKLPGVLVAARRYADACIAVRRGGEDAEHDDAVIVVDGMSIERDVFRAHLAHDRPGGAALARLREWVLPSVATWTRDREVLGRAKADRALLDAAWAMADSEASWLRTLLATEIDARWRLVLAHAEPVRVLELRVDGVSSNFDLHALVERALARHGVGIPDPYGDDGAVSASLELLTWSGITLVQPGGGVRGLPMNEVVWREGLPTDVPELDGVRTLVATRAAIQRGWRAGRPFSAMIPEVTITRELPRADAARLVADMRARADALVGGS